MAPGLGLYLDEVFFENYNKCQAKQAAEHGNKYPTHSAKAAVKVPDGSNDDVKGKADDENDNEPVRIIYDFTHKFARCLCSKHSAKWL